MTEHSPSDPVTPIRKGKYAWIERGRRFLLSDPPHMPAVVATYHITHRYLTDTRLRHMRYIDTGNDQYKLTQKISTAGGRVIQHVTSGAAQRRQPRTVAVPA